jgi:threonyl-tRNA synthetase
MDKPQIKDHRKIAQEQELFFLNENVGLGLPLWLPKGATIRRELEQYMINLEIKEGYHHVVTPDIAKLSLYKTSGHWQHYKSSMFPVMEREKEEYILRPMNCPHHIEVFNHKPRSYRELPLRIAEFGTLYRWENSGELSGLIRTRAMTLNDAHIFCSLEQVKDEFKKTVELIEKVYSDLGIKNFWYRLSLHDPKDKKKFGDDPNLWKTSEQAIKDALKDLDIDYKEAVGEAAFYGPKLDVQIPNALGKDETVSTVQLDFYLPQRFNLEYIGDDGEKHPIVMIHRGIVSTLERMVGFLIEQYQGVFPLWLSPVQLTIIPISEKHLGYGKKLLEEFKKENIRVELDDRNETMQAKIRDATLQKTPYMGIIGDREQSSETISLRTREEKDLGKFNIQDLISKIKQEIDKKV